MNNRVLVMFELKGFEVLDLLFPFVEPLLDRTNGKD